MRAMILAAGRGQRMGVLTEHIPKPLLRVGKHFLIEYALFNLKRAGILNVVINVSYHGEQIKQALGNGQQYGMTIAYSEEVERLETGGGIYKALPFLGNEPFLVVSSDVVTDFACEKLVCQREKTLAHLVLVKNPAYHPQGDFGLSESLVVMEARVKFTYANLGVYSPELFQNSEPGCFRLSEVLIPAINAGKVTGEVYNGLWYNIGTGKDLEQINQPNIDIHTLAN